MNLSGLLIGLVSFLAIGIFHPIVIKAEYHFSKKIWPVFALLGIVMLAVSLFLDSTVGSAGSAVVGMSSFWSIKELFEQEKRVKKGWFPKKSDKKEP